MKALTDSPPIEVEVSIEDKLVTEEEALSILKGAGLVHIQDNHLSKLTKLGAYARGAGSITMIRGGAIMVQARATRALDVLGDLLEKVLGDDSKNKAAQATKLAHEMGYLISKITESHKMVTALESLVPVTPNDASPSKVQSFKPGENVRPGPVTNNYIQTDKVVIGAEKK